MATVPSLDWPRTLRLSAAIRPLAKALYAGHCTVDGTSPIAYGDLETHMRRFYEDIAVQILRGLTQPRSYFELAVEQATAHRDKVIGQITPEEPYGIDPRD